MSCVSVEAWLGQIFDDCIDFLFGQIFELAPDLFAECIIALRIEQLIDGLTVGSPDHGDLLSRGRT
jgi:hypothetical protein